MKKTRTGSYFVLDEFRPSRELLKCRVRRYGFIEISDILRFLDSVCKPVPDDSDLLYIRSKIEKCLDTHDNQSAYFIPLRELATELDCFVHFQF